MKHELDLIIRIEDLLSELKGRLGLITAPKKLKVVDSTTVDKKRPKMPSGLTGMLLGLIADGFFNHPKTLSEIQKKLRDDGTIKPVTTLQAPLVELVRGKKLERTKPDKGPYVYKKRSGT